MAEFKKKQTIVAVDERGVSLVLISDVLSLPDVICRMYGFTIASVFATENCHDMHERIYMPKTT